MTPARDVIAARGAGPDLAAAGAFMTANARLLDRQRFLLLLGKGEPAGVLAALAAHHNDDGGYGWALEPDLRAAPSQRVGAMLALEVLAEVADAAPREHVAALLDWLSDHTLPDGGLPFALPILDPTGCARHWLEADPATSSLQMTSQVAGKAHLLGRRLPSVAAHPWLARATRYCLDVIADLEQAPSAYELLFTLQFLDTVAEELPEADELLAAMGRFVPADGRVPVADGAADETLHPLDLAPRPGRPVRRLVPEPAVAADLDRLARLQQDDGGWIVDFDSSSPVAALEWRGYMTVAAVATLLAH